MLEVVISLVGRLVFPPEKLKDIVMKRKKNPEDYLKAYNLCDGEHIVSQIADEIHVTKQTLSPIMSEWKELGIIYEVTKSGGKFYKKLYKLDMPKSGKVQEEKVSEEVAEQETVVQESDKKQDLESQSDESIS